MIGRSFPEPVLRSVSEAGDDLATNLATLQAAGLISETASTPEREYAFHHSLTQEATYGTILLRVRRELHRRVGEVFEELYASRIEEFAPLLPVTSRKRVTTSGRWRTQPSPATTPDASMPMPRP
ncbi:MAG: hypothetical protein EHM22_03340 [Actinobacteria bacterium]|nr:MAG: hypothetical protein EHM22_03340 [Actinomycetota bacterium]